MIFKRLFQRPAPAARNAYEAIVAAARHPVFYAEWGVPDTVDGRFDMIALHAFLVLDRLKGTADRFRQDLVDELFRDMDRSLREMGASDVSVGKKVRKMAEVFYGRIAAYDQALVAGPAQLEEAISRNVFADGPVGGGAARLSSHLVESRRFLAAQAAEVIAAGRIAFQEPNS